MPSPVTAAAVNVAQSTQSAQTQFSTDTFMKLLVAELQNQDPMEPMDSKEMMQQLTQLTTVSQLEELGQALQTQSAYRVTEMADLIGRTVEWTDQTTGNPQSGSVERADHGYQGWTVQVNGQPIPLDWINSVR